MQYAPAYNRGLSTMVPKQRKGVT